MVRVPAVTAEQMREVDRLMIEEYGIVLLQMMENAGRNLARLIARQAWYPVLVLAGKGNNGGGGLAAARHLRNMGRDVWVLVAEPDALGPAPAHQHKALRAMDTKFITDEHIHGDVFNNAMSHAGVIVDALLGYSFAGAPRGAYAGLIEAANASGAPIVALDVPSGLDPTDGGVPGVCMDASATLTLALPKTGMASPAARDRIGELYLADISVPRALYSRMGIEAPDLFGEDGIVRLTWDGRGWAT